MLLVMFVILIAVTTLTEQAAEAGERAPGFSSGFNAGIARFSDGDLGTGLSGRAFVEFAPYIPEIALRLSGGYLHFSDEITLGNGTFSSTQDVDFEDLAGVKYIEKKYG